MAIRFISEKTTRLYKSATSASFEQVLLYGEEVNVTGSAQNGRRKAVYREKYEGFVKADHLMNDRQLEIYFIDVGQGDATFIVTPGNKKILIDGGANARALGFISWKYQLWHEQTPPIDIDLLVLTHADGDHLDGLTPVVCHPRVRIKKVIHNGLALYQAGTDERLGNFDASETYITSVHNTLQELLTGAGIQLSADFKEWRDEVVARNIPYQRVDTTNGFIDIGDPDISIEVLGPKTNIINGKPACKWLDDHAHTINGHSVVLRLTYGDVHLLLSGDLNIPGGEYLMQDLNQVAKFNAHIFKSPHHGSHEFHLPLLEAIRPQISVISSGDSPDHGHPRASFLGAIGLASRSTMPLVFATEIAATFVDATEADIQDMFSASVIDRDELARVKLFKRTLHGMINVRTDGQDLYAARRVQTGYWWEAYGPMAPAPRPALF